MKVELQEDIFTGDVNNVCHVNGPNKHLYIGRSDGRIAVLEGGSLETSTGSSSGNQSVLETGHQGAITCMTMAMNCMNSNGTGTSHDLLVTGSADRTIKIFHHQSRRMELKNVQTLQGHGGTITAIAFGGGLKAQRLISCSTDQTIRIWSSRDDRSLLLYPWFELAQSISNRQWFTSIVLGPVQSQNDCPIIFAGDSKGYISIFKPKAPESRTILDGLGSSGKINQVSHKNYQLDNFERYKIHNLGIYSLLMLPQQNLVLTLSYDCTIRVFDVAGRAAFLTIKNKRRCRYTCATWDPLNHELLAADEQLFLESWNIYTDRCLMSQDLARIYASASSSSSAATSTAPAGDEEKGDGPNNNNNKVDKGQDLGVEEKVNLEQSSNNNAKVTRVNGGITSCSISAFVRQPCLNVTVGSNFQVWSVLRDLEFKEYPGHGEDVIALVCDDIGVHATQPQPETPKRTTRYSKPSTSSKEEQKTSHPAPGGFLLFSVGLDNMLCAWDWYDMSCMYRLQEPNSEVACMVRLPDSGMIASGNEDGSIRIWNYDTGSTLVLNGHENTVSCLAVARRKRNTNTLLISGGYDGKIGVWDVSKRGASFSPRLECMFSATKKYKSNQQIRRGSTASTSSHSLNQEEKTHESKTTSQDDKLFELLSRTEEGQELLCIAFSPGNGARQDVFITGGNDGVGKVWSLTTYELVGQLEGHDDAITAIVVDANFAISGSDDKTIRLWNLSQINDPYQVAVLCGHDAPIRSLLVIPDHHSEANLVSCSVDAIKVWDYTATSEDDEAADYETGKIVKEYEAPSNNEFRSITYCATRNEILVGTKIGTIMAYPI